MLQYLACASITSQNMSVCLCLCVNEGGTNHNRVTYEICDPASVHQSINQSINQSWIYTAHKRKASNALVR